MFYEENLEYENIEGLCKNNQWRKSVGIGRLRIQGLKKKGKKGLKVNSIWHKKHRPCGEIIVAAFFSEANGPCGHGNLDDLRAAEVGCCISFATSAREQTELFCGLAANLGLLTTLYECCLRLDWRNLKHRWAKREKMFVCAFSYIYQVPNSAF